MNRKIHVGLVAEDLSDVETLKIIVKKITQNSSIKFSHFIGRGCGKIHKKCSSWVRQLELKGCKQIIVVHDLDRNNYKELYATLSGLINPYQQDKHLINIPVEEMEAWFLADMEAIKTVFKLAKAPKAISNPENVKSPKEKITEIVYTSSKKTKEYLNTSHNKKLAEHISIDIIKTKCSSFKQLHEFVSNHIK